MQRGELHCCNCSLFVNPSYTNHEMGMIFYEKSRERFFIYTGFHKWQVFHLDLMNFLNNNFIILVWKIIFMQMLRWWDKTLMILEKTWVKVFQSNSFFQTLPGRVMNSYLPRQWIIQKQLEFEFPFFSFSIRVQKVENCSTRGPFLKYSRLYITKYTFLNVPSLTTFKDKIKKEN